MKFPWDKYIEIPSCRRNTLQVFITNQCNLKCSGCFAKNIIGESDEEISFKEYAEVVDNAIKKGVKQINILGGEPTLHCEFDSFLHWNNHRKLKTTVYSNGQNLGEWSRDHFYLCFDPLFNAKLRISIYSRTGTGKSLENLEGLKHKRYPLEFCFMVSSKTYVDELIYTAMEVEKDYNCNVFFISSIRELDNRRKEFFDDTSLTMPLLKYKEFVHAFLRGYQGNMEIHISKRGVFESTKTLAENRCRFANYFIGGKIIQCPYDAVNLKYQDDYEFNERYCQQNNSCLMSKIIVKRKE